MSFQDIIFLNAKDYLGTVCNIHINLILCAIALALSVASFFINHHKTYNLAIIKALLRKEATTDDTAKTLAEIRLSDSWFLRRALSRNGQLTKIVKRVGAPEYTYDDYMALTNEEKKGERIDFSTARFFIPEANVERAKLIREKENPTVFRTALLCLLIISVTVCLMLLMPAILNLISNNLP